MEHANVSIGSSGRGQLRVGADFGGLGSGWLSSTLSTVRRWSERRSQRRALGLLDERMLKDIGLTRTDVAHEQRKPFWQI